MNRLTQSIEVSIFLIHFVKGPLLGTTVIWCGHRYGYFNDKKTNNKSKNTLSIDSLMMGELFQNNRYSKPNSINF